MANTSIRNLLLSLIHKRYLKTSATLAPTPSSSSFAVEYLVNSCGLPLQSAISASKELKLHKNNLQNPQSVLDFLKSHAFNDTHIAKLIVKSPKILLCRVQETLKPKFEFFITNGFAGKLLPELIISNPSISKVALDARLKPSFELLKSFLYSNEKIVLAVKRSSWLLKFDLKRIMQPNIDFLIREGVPFNCVTKMILKYPRTAMHKHDRMVYAVNAVKNLGLQPKSPMFMRAVTVMLSMSELTWRKKIEVLKSFGWIEEEILQAFKREPFCLASSEEKIRHAMDFYVNTMKLEPQTIISYPKFLLYAIDKRIRPRYNVLKVLELKSLIKGDKKIVWLLTIDEKKFLENYVKKYIGQVPGLLDIYGVSTSQKS